MKRENASVERRQRSRQELLPEHARRVRAALSVLPALIPSLSADLTALRRWPLVPGSCSRTIVAADKPTTALVDNAITFRVLDLSMTIPLCAPETLRLGS